MGAHEHSRPGELWGRADRGRTSCSTALGCRLTVLAFGTTTRPAADIARAGAQGVRNSARGRCIIAHTGTSLCLRSIAATWHERRPLHGSFCHVDIRVAAGAARARRASPMPAKKRSAGGDFVKKRQKVGKKKLAPTNSTATAFKARSVLLPDQSIAVDRSDKLVSHRQLTLDELLGQLGHYSADVRRDAARGMGDFLARHPDMLLPHAAEVLRGTLGLLSAAEGAVRRAAGAVLRTALPPLAEAGALEPHEQTLRLQLQAALSHHIPAIRADAIPPLVLLLQVAPLPPPPARARPRLVVPSWPIVRQVRPTALRPPPAQLLPSLVDLLGVGGGCHVDADGAAASGARGESERATTAQTRALALDAIRALLAAQQPPAAAPQEDPPPAPPRFAYARWRGDSGAACEGLAHAAHGSTSASAAVALRAQLDALPSVLARCWIEAGVWLPAHASDAAALDVAAAVMAVAAELLRTPPDADDDSAGRGVARALLPLFMRHVAPHVPLPPHEPVGRGSDAIAARRAQLDAALCEVLSRLLHLTAAATVAVDHDDAPAASSDAPTDAAARDELAARLGAYLAAQLRGRANSRHVVHLLRAARALLPLAAAARADVLSVLIGLWEEAPPAAAYRAPLLDVLCEWTFPPSLGVTDVTVTPFERMGVADSARWLRCVPKLLWQLRADQPQLSAAMLRALLALGRCGGLDASAPPPAPLLAPLLPPSDAAVPSPADALADAPTAPERGATLDSLQSSLVPFFCSARAPPNTPVLGPFGDLSAECRRLALSLLIYLRPITPAMAGGLSHCARHHPALAPSISHALESAAAAGSLSIVDEVRFYVGAAIDAPPADADAAGTADHVITPLFEFMLRALERAALRRGRSAVLDVVRDEVRAVCDAADSAQRADSAPRARSKRAASKGGKEAAKGATRARAAQLLLERLSDESCRA